MTMSLAGPGLTTTNTKKRKAKGFTKHDHAAATAHDKWLRKMGTHPDQLKARKKKPVNTLPFERDRSHERQGNTAPSAGAGAGGHAAPAEPKTYNGARKLLGIATLHKSNMVPVFSQEDATEIARMRRG